MPERGARIPAVQAQLREQVLVEPHRRRVVARRVAAGRDRGQQEERRRQEVEEHEEDRAEAEGVGGVLVASLPGTSGGV